MGAGLRIGMNCKFYRNTGTYGSPTWTVIPITKDLSLKLSKDKASIKTRGSTWEQTLPVHKKAPLDFKLLGDESDTNFDAVRDAYVADTLLDLAIADDVIATTGTRYFRADYYVYDFSIDEPFDDRSASVACDIGYSTHTPAFTTV